METRHDLDPRIDHLEHRRRNRPWLFAALAVAVLVLIGLFAIPNDDRPSTAQVPASSSAPASTAPAAPAPAPTPPAPSR